MQLSFQENSSAQAGSILYAGSMNVIFVLWNEESAHNT